MVMSVCGALKHHIRDVCAAKHLLGAARPHSCTNWSLLALPGLVSCLIIRSSVRFTTTASQIIVHYMMSAQMSYAPCIAAKRPFAGRTNTHCMQAKS